MKKILFIISVVIISLSVSNVFAVTPYSTIDANRQIGLIGIKNTYGIWSHPLPVYSDTNITIYINADAVTMEPDDYNAMSKGWNNLYSYIEEEGFSVVMVIEYKSKKVLKPMIDSMKKRYGEYKFEMNRKVYPDLLKYRRDLVWVDLRNNSMNLGEDQYLDCDGELISANYEKFQLEIKSDPIWSKTANNIVQYFKKAMNNPDPKIRGRLSDYATMYNNDGLIYYKRGQYKDALKNLDIAIRFKPDDASMYYNRGIIYATLNQYHEAFNDLSKAIQLKPYYVKAYINRAIIYQKLEQYQDAIKDIDKAIRLEPDNAEAYNNRGYIYNKLEQYQRAIKDLDEAIRLKPDYAEAHSYRGLSYILSGNKIEGCLSLVHACELKYCKDYDLSKQKGDCQ
ncbi:MAG: tetratricopeptide repeat protein [Smithella sp.]|jgi:tetratricopeptide (TPR) repeat protein